MLKITLTYTVSHSDGLFHGNRGTRYRGLRSVARCIASTFSVVSQFMQNGLGSLGDNSVTYLSGIQLIPGVYRHAGATAWNQKWLLEDGPTAEVSDYCHAHSVQWEKEGKCLRDCPHSAGRPAPATAVNGVLTHTEPALASYFPHSVTYTSSDTGAFVFPKRAQTSCLPRLVGLNMLCGFHLRWNVTITGRSRKSPSLTETSPWRWSRRKSRMTGPADTSGSSM